MRLPTLNDLGERRIVAEVLPRFVEGIGDDCARLSVVSGTVVVTTDPVPIPAARLLGNDPDPFYMGWLLVTINASDLAAGGARPLGFLSAIQAPGTLGLHDFERFLEGTAAACASEGLRYVGGNLKEGPELTAVGTAIGFCEGAPLGRKGARDGDIVASLGQGGVFWRDVMTIRAGREVPRETSPLYRPKSQLAMMQELTARQLVTAAIDNSDGLLPSLQQLALASGVELELDVSALEVPNVVTGPESVRYWLGWGDWNVLVCLPPGNLQAARDVAIEAGGALIPIGRARGGLPRVLWAQSLREVARLESERFAADSWFVGGIDSYLSALLSTEIPAQEKDRNGS